MQILQKWPTHERYGNIINTVSQMEKTKET